MPSNVEIKARAADWDAQRARAAALCDRAEELTQEDTFFPCGNGRLKLRGFGLGRPGELIFYRRPDRAGPKTSEYDLASVADAAAMKGLLSQAWGEGRTVRKTRSVYLVGQTRVHFDEVEGLGRFIELEVCLRPGQTEAEGRTVAERLMSELGIEASALLEGAYVDMLFKEAV